MRRTIQALVIAPLLICALALPLAAQGNSCPQLREWIQANRATLPTTYDGLLALPLAYRPAVFDALTPDVKEKLLTTHLQRYIDEHPGLSPDQIGVIQEAIALVRQPDFFILRPTDALWNSTVHRPIQDLERKALSQFSREEFKEIFTRLGGDTAASWAGGRQVSTTKAAPICTCSTQSDWCSSGTHCAAGGCSLTTGCGTLFRYTCNGFCYFN